MNVDNLFLAFNCIKIQWLLSVCLIMRCVCIVKKVSCFGMSKVRPYERKGEYVCVFESKLLMRRRVNLFKNLIFLTAVRQCLK